MIDKQKLLQWIEDKKEVYGPPYDTEFELKYNTGKVSILNLLMQQIKLGEFDA